MQLFKSAALAVVCAGVAAAAASGQSVEDILARLDANVSYESIRYSGRMEITVGGETRYKTMDVIAEGTNKAFAEFTNPEDRGTRYLKLDKNLWIYFPKEQDTVKISGHLLKEGMMGSDVSYEDALESADYRARYSPALKGEDTVNGRRCYVVELSAKVPTASYDKQLLWIDAERFVRLKAEMYAKSGKLLKVGYTLDVVHLGDRWFPARTELVSKLRNNTKTVFSMDRIDIGAAVDDRQFSLAALSK
ncbi:MAG: outer membrane lipoprotein-sorting protein [Spirochaetia bacterium]|jgi:outer membrane lipoprotein-sorting protein